MSLMRIVIYMFRCLYLKKIFKLQEALLIQPDYDVIPATLFCISVRKIIFVLLSFFVSFQVCTIALGDGFSESFGK